MNPPFCASYVCVYCDCKWVCIIGMSDRRSEEISGGPSQVTDYLLNFIDFKYS